MSATVAIVNDSLYTVYSILYTVGGWGAEPNREIVSFRVLRARGAYVRSDPGEKVRSALFPFPFSLFRREAFPFPFPRPPTSYPASAGFIGKTWTA